MLSANVDDAAITREIAINLTAPIMLTRQSLPLLKRGTQPLILMVTSGYALLPARRAPTYSATKAGLRAFTQALRYQLENTGIRVVEILPIGGHSDHGRDPKAEDVAGGSSRGNLTGDRPRSRRGLGRTGASTATLDAHRTALRRAARR